MAQVMTPREWRPTGNRIDTASFQHPHPWPANYPGPSPGFSGRGAKNQKERPKTRRGATILKYSIGCMQQPGSQTWNGGHRFQMGGPGAAGPLAGDDPATTVSRKYAYTDDLTIVHAHGDWHAAKGRGVTRGAKGAQFPGRQLTMGVLNHCGGAELLREPPKSPNNVTSTFFNTANYFSKELRFHHGGAKLRIWGRRFDHGGAKLVFCPGRHLTSLHPWRKECSAKTRQLLSMNSSW